MKRITAAMGIAMMAVGGFALAGTLGPADDDLAVVKKAVARPAPKVASSAPAASPRPAAPEASPLPVARSGREPQWFRVRVVDKATGRKKVTVNLPLSLVRALGDEPIDWGCHNHAEHERCHTMKISDVLRSLEAGQELVEIEDEEATVRVWVE